GRKKGGAGRADAVAAAAAPGARGDGGPVAGGAHRLRPRPRGGGDPGERGRGIGGGGGGAGAGAGGGGAAAGPAGGGAGGRARGGAGGLREWRGHFVKVRKSYGAGLFPCYDVADVPRTNNALEQLFGSHRYHERRSSGRKAASPGLVIRGAVRVVAGVATRLQ